MAESSVARVFILSVTRDLGDSLGGEMAELVAEAGLTLAGRDLVQPEAEAVRTALARRLADANVQAVIVLGAAERWGQDAGSRAVADQLARPLPGFAELYRAQLLASRGALVLLDDVQGGLTEKRKALFALPGDAAALSAARALALPLISELLARAEAALHVESPAAKAAPGKGAPARPLPEPDDDDEAASEEAPPPPDGVSVTQIAAPKPKEDKELLSSGWEAGQRALDAELRRGWPVIPEAFERLSAALDVLNAAGQRGELALKDGRKAGAFAFPDFSRVDSRILVVSEGEGIPEVIALHRHPRPVGTVVEGGLLALPTRDAAELSERMFGRGAPGGGELFAVEGDAVYLRRGAKIWRWDGKREQDQGTASQVLASLMLRWSQR